ncbi:MAG: hypothetical protein ACR2O2_09500 [Ruegeria sp.]
MTTPSSSKRSSGDPSPRDVSAVRFDAVTVVSKAALVGITVIVLGFLAATRLLYPLDGDGALFLTAARIIDDGGVLYVDFWDVKQPGIFYFYWLAGNIFEFTFLGVQFFQLVYWAVIGTAVCILIRPYFVHPWIAVLVPFVFLATYYAYAGTNHHAQVEIIASGPLFLSAICLAKATECTGSDRNWRLILAGSFGAFVILLKIALAPILLAFFVVYLVSGLRNGRAINRIALDGAIVLFGGTLVLTVVVVALFLNGGLTGAIETAFLIGPEWARAAPQAPLSRLFKGGVSFVGSFGAWIGLAVLGLASLRSLTRRPLAAYCCAWILGALVCILIQRFSWWAYHWQLLYLPTAVLAALGADCGLSWLGNRWKIGERAKVLVALSVLAPFLFTYSQVLADRRALIKEHRTEISQSDYAGFRAAVSPRYSRAAEIVASLPGDVQHQSIYVMGDPLIYVIHNARQAIPVHGWALEFFSPRDWARMMAELEVSNTQAIFISSDYRQLVNEKASEISDFLASRYLRGPELDTGDWYFVKQVQRNE